MVKLFKFYRASLTQLRQFMLPIQFSGRQVFKNFMMMIFMIACLRTAQMVPIFNGIVTEVKESVQYIPDYEYVDDQYVLKDGQTPLYYSANTFQLVIDPTVDTSQRIDSIQLTRQQRDMLNVDTELNLFIFSDRTFVSYFGNLQELPSDNPILRNSDSLKFVLSNIASNRISVYLASIVAQFILTIPTYLFEVVILALFLGFYHTFLNSPIPFNHRFKMGLYVYFVPTFVIEVINIFYPFYSFSLMLKVIVSMIMFYYIFKDHTRHVHKMMTEFGDDAMKEFLRKALEDQEDEDKND